MGFGTVVRRLVAARQCVCVYVRVVAAHPLERNILILKRFIRCRLHHIQCVEAAHPLSIMFVKRFNLAFSVHGAAHPLHPHQHLTRSRPRPNR